MALLLPASTPPAGSVTITKLHPIALVGWIPRRWRVFLPKNTVYQEVFRGFKRRFACAGIFATGNRPPASRLLDSEQNLEEFIESKDYRAIIVLINASLLVDQNGFFLLELQTASPQSILGYTAPAIKRFGKLVPHWLGWVHDLLATYALGEGGLELAGPSLEPIGKNTVILEHKLVFRVGEFHRGWSERLGVNIPHQHIIIRHHFDLESETTYVQVGWSAIPSKTGFIRDNPIEARILCEHDMTELTMDQAKGVFDCSGPDDAAPPICDYEVFKYPFFL